MTCYSWQGEDREQNVCESIDDADARTERGDGKTRKINKRGRNEEYSTLAGLIDYDIALSYANLLMSVTCHQTSMTMMMMMMMIEEVDEETE